MKHDAGKEEFWRQVIGEAASSGKSVRGFCEERDLNKDQFYWWRRELRRRDGEHGERRGFVELVAARGARVSAGVSLKIDDRISIVLERGFDSETLKAALGVVGAV